MNAETITALTPICKYVLVSALVLAALYLLRDPLRRLLDRLITVKLRTRAVEAELSAPLTTRTEAAPTPRYEERVPLEETPRPEEGLQPTDMEPADARQYAERMLAAFRDGDLAAAQAAFTETQQLEHDPVKRKQYAALYAMCRYEEGDTHALADLRQLTEQDDVAAMANRLLGQCYEDAGDFSSAAEAYQASARLADSELERADAAVHAAMSVFKDGKQQDAYAMLMNEVSELTVAEALCTVYEGLASLYGQAEDPEMRALALEKALEFKPNDMKLRFRAAYSYGEKNLEPLALLHYKTLLRFDGDESSSLNNLGVTCSRLDMPIRAIDSYQAAASNETLAAANLARAYIGAGFKREALEVISEARKQAEVDPSVGAVMQVVSEIDEAEADAEARYMDAAREQQRFLLCFAAAYFTQEAATPIFAGDWRFSDGAKATVSQADYEIEANWVAQNVKYRFTGHINNRAARIMTFKSRYPPGKQTEFSEDRHGYVYLSADDQQLFVMTIKGHEHALETLTRHQEGF